MKLEILNEFPTRNSGKEIERLKYTYTEMEHKEEHLLKYFSSVNT